MTSVLKTKAGQYSQFIRKQNQDAGLLQLNFLGEKYCSLSGVYDGHGEYGAQVSNFVKKSLIKYLTKEIKQQGGLDGENADIPSCLRRAYLQTNKDLLAQNMFDVSMSGSTAVTVLQYKNELYCANTGDSRAITVRFTSHCEWKQIELSKDHKPEIPEERARIVASGGRVEQSSNEDGEKSGIYRVWKKNQDLPGLAMSRSMGDTMGRECGVIAEPEIIQHTLSDEDKMIVIASDGVWEFLSNADISRILAPFYREGKINESVDKVIQLSHKEWLKEGDSVDDITCIAYFISGFKECND